MPPDLVPAQPVVAALAAGPRTQPPALLPPRSLGAAVVAEAPVQERVIDPTDHPVQGSRRVDAAVVVRSLLFIVLLHVLRYLVDLLIDRLHRVVDSELQVVHNLHGSVR